MIDLNRSNDPRDSLVILETETGELEVYRQGPDQRFVPSGYRGVGVVQLTK
jgi:hypothetical protein